MVTGSFRDTFKCPIYDSDRLKAVYTPERSLSYIIVPVRAQSGLVQNLPRAERAPRMAPAVSSGADWGNVRYGKGFRTKIALDAVLRHRQPSRKLFLAASTFWYSHSFARALLDETSNSDHLCGRTGRARGAILRRPGCSKLPWVYRR